MMFKYAFIASVGIASAFAAATPAIDLKSVLQQSKNKWSPNTQIFFPREPHRADKTTQGYNVGSANETTPRWNISGSNETSPRWNIYSAPSYVASIKPGSEADVQKVVSQPVCSVQFCHYQIPFFANLPWRSYRSNLRQPINSLSSQPVVDMATVRHLVSFKTALSSI